MRDLDYGRGDPERFPARDLAAWYGLGEPVTSLRIRGYDLNRLEAADRFGRALAARFVGDAWYAVMPDGGVELL